MLVWTHKGQRACQTVVSWHFTIGWKLTSTHYFISAQLCLVLIILAQEMLFCSHEYVRNLCVPFKLSCWRSAIRQGSHVRLMARTNESEKAIRTLQSSPGTMGICCKPYLFKHLVLSITESSAPVKTTASLSKYNYSFVFFLCSESKIHSRQCQIQQKTCCLCSLGCFLLTGQTSIQMNLIFKIWTAKLQPVCVSWEHEHEEALRRSQGCTISW